MWKRVLSEENSIHHIILYENTPAGILTFGQPMHENPGIDDSYWELHGIYLHLDYYHQGIGTKALEFAMEKAREAGKKNMLLWVFEENLNAIKFYKKCGFSPDGVRKVYNCGKDIECIRMRRAI
ncbi:MAG: GNAT family N-acetyltransferase [Clostridiales bacterium]|nr:GNAT family N-acetyltransferase [Clostridiales bacterium]